MKPAILLDLDGTLVDSREDIAASANVVRQHFALDVLPLETIVTFVGDGVGKLLERCCPDLNEVQVAESRRVFQANYLKHCCDATAAYAGIVEVVARFAKEGHPLAVVTNKPKQFSELIIKHIGLDTYIPVIVGGDTHRKPDPDSIYDACEQLGVSAQNAWMCGDHHTDLIAGRRAGCKTMWCAWGIGSHHDQPFDVQCDAPIDMLKTISADE